MTTLQILSAFAFMALVGMALGYWLGWQCGRAKESLIRRAHYDNTFRQRFHAKEGPPMHRAGESPASTTGSAASLTNSGNISSPA